MDRTRYQEERKRTNKHKTIIDFVPCFNESFCLLSLAYFNGNFVSLTITFKLQDFSYLLDYRIELLEVLLKMTVIIGIKQYVIITDFVFLLLPIKTNRQSMGCFFLMIGRFEQQIWKFLRHRVEMSNTAFIILTLTLKVQSLKN